MRILALETSCDETAAAVVENGRRILSNVVASQMEHHARFGGIYPEVASRQHVLSIDGVVAQALAQAQVETVADLDALAVTCGPGLVGSLMVGVNAAKGISLTSGLPLIGVNHLAGHIHSLWLEAAGAVGCPAADLAWPMVILIVSGGHTDLVLMQDFGQVRVLGGTLDDAAGEAFDKVARVLGLGFPGGPAIQNAAEQGRAETFALPYPLQHDEEHRFDFSFSGLKTAMLHQARAAGLKTEDSSVQLPTQTIRDLAASFQAQVASILLDRMEDATQAFAAASVGLCGGVSANAWLRAEALRRFAQRGIPLRIPPLALCTDNAAMIGAAAFRQWRPAAPDGEGLELDVYARMPLSGPSPVA